MKRQTKILMSLLAIFVVGMTLGVAFGESGDIATFKSSGYEWKIKSSTWETMKKQANDQYKNRQDVGSINPGYSDSVDVTVTKDGKTYQGVAYAVQNDHSIRCEVRKALPHGERLMANETPTGV